ncbi:HAD family hydrolase [bacterium]|nr:HAD family hydrolase [bacterium]
MIKLIATDIDGTLLNYDRTLPSELMSCLEKLQKNGIKVVPVTGRMYKAAVQIYEKMNFKDALVSYQGGQINDSDGKIIYQKVLDTDTVRKGISWARENNVHLQIYTNDELYAENDNDFIKRYSDEQKVSYSIVNFDEMEIKYASKMLALDFNNPETVSVWVNDLIKMFPECFIVKSSPYFCEISNKNANKYDSVKFLQEYYGLKDDEVLTIGDQNNDIALLEAGGIRVAMGNASEELKAVATYITDDVKDNGWANAIEHFCKL